MPNTHGNPLSVSCHGHSWHELAMGRGGECMAGSGLDRGEHWLQARSDTSVIRRKITTGERPGLNCISISYQPPTWNCHCLIIHCLMPGTCDSARTPRPSHCVDTVLGTEPHLVERLWPEFLGAWSQNSPWQLYKHTRLTCLDEAEDKEGCCQGEEKLWVHDAVWLCRGWHHVWLSSDTR